MRRAPRWLVVAGLLVLVAWSHPAPPAAAAEEAGPSAAPLDKE